MAKAAKAADAPQLEEIEEVIAEAETIVEASEETLEQNPNEELAALKAQVAECLQKLNSLASNPQSPADLNPLTEKLAVLTSQLESLNSRVDKLSTPLPSPEPPTPAPEAPPARTPKIRML